MSHPLEQQRRTAVFIAYLLTKYARIEARGHWRRYINDVGGQGAAARGRRGFYREGGIDYLLNYSQGTFTRASLAAWQDPRASWGFASSSFYLLHTYSTDITDWSDTGTPGETTGVSDHLGGTDAVTTEDDDGAATEGHSLASAAGLVDGHVEHYVDIPVLKDNDETRFPEFQITAGSSTFYGQINTKTGATTVRFSANMDFTEITCTTHPSDSTWWLVRLRFARTATTASVLTVGVRPAAGNTLGGNDVSATGTLTWYPGVTVYRHSAWKRVDEPRLFGGNILIEGARTNLVTDGRDLSAAAWAAVGTPTITAGYDSGVDGRQDGASRAQATSADALYDSMGTTASSVYQVSAFQREISGTGPEVLRATGGASSQSTGDASADTNWVRRTISYTAGATTNIIPLEGRDTSGEGGLAAGSRDHLVDLCQVELGNFPSTSIQTYGGSATRAVDLLQYSGGTWDDRINDAVWEFDAWLNFADSDMATGAFRYFFNVGSTEILYLYNNAGSVEVRLNRNGISGFTPTAVTFSAHQKLTIKVDWPNQTITLSGFTTGNGDFATLTNTDWGMTPASDILVVGGGAVAGRELHGIISRPRAA